MPLDEIAVNLGKAFGEDGNDTLFAMTQGSGWELDGGTGNDVLQFKGRGKAEGGDGSDAFVFAGAAMLLFKTPGQVKWTRSSSLRFQQSRFLLEPDRW